MPREQYRDSSSNCSRSQNIYYIIGHNESFKTSAKPDTILKQLEGNEAICLKELENDELYPFIPKVLGIIQEDDGKTYIEMQNLVADFQDACVMDIKMGCRTYREAELDKAIKDQKPRSDMYKKMIEIDKFEPNYEEHQIKAITKPRYMIWRETISSSSNFGFRIEGMRMSDGTVDKNFKTIRDDGKIAESLMRFARTPKIRMQYLRRLYDLRQALMKSKFFSSHEMIGSSLLFVHDKSKANIWLIDFAKTHHLPVDTEITHARKWEPGNHEDGYLTGVDNLIRIFESIILIQMLNC